MKINIVPSFILEVTTLHGPYGLPSHISWPIYELIDPQPLDHSRLHCHCALSAHTARHCVSGIHSHAGSRPACRAGKTRPRAGSSSAVRLAHRRRCHLLHAQQFAETHATQVHVPSAAPSSQVGDPIATWRRLRRPSPARGQRRSQRGSHINVGV